MEKTLSGKVAIVTGASAGIGRATALAFARAGAKVVVTGRREAELASLVAEIVASDGVAVAVVGDVRAEAHAAEVVATAIDRFGGLDVAINNAGAVGDTMPIDAMPLETWKSTVDVNLTAAFFAAKAQIPALRARGGGSLVFTSSFVGYTAGIPGMGAYAAAKAGLIGLVKTLAVELGGEKIRVNALLPGGTATAAAPSTEEGRAWVRHIHALKRMAAPEEIAAAALFLASDASTFMTGSAMLVDGGVSISRT